MTSQQKPASADVQWRKSSYSNASNQCVEVARIGGGVAVRDSKNPGGGHLTISVAGWGAFLDGVRHGSYDR
jgi:hypothetical protein